MAKYFVCRLGKLHWTLGRLAKQLAWARDGWGKLATVANARAALAGCAELAGLANFQRGSEAGCRIDGRALGWVI